MLVWIGGYATHRLREQAEPSLWKTTTAQLGEDKVRVLCAEFVVPERGKR